MIKPHLDPLLDGFVQQQLDLGEIEILVSQAGQGEPLLLLHGWPQSHVIWHRMATQLAQHFTVIATDLRGYGDSSKPVGLPDHSNYSKRVMAQDQIDVMQRLGFEHFYVLGHDRGARVAHRMAVDHPDRVRKLVTLDIVPTLAMYEQTSEAFARAYYHWFFLIRPTPYPETLIGAEPQVFLDHSLALSGDIHALFHPDAYAEYLRHIRNPATIHGFCEDYRAATSIDLEHDRADRKMGRKVQCDLLALWGNQGYMAKAFDPLAEWQAVCDGHLTGKGLPCGHYMPEEIPQQLLAEIIPFLTTH